MLRTSLTTTDSSLESETQRYLPNLNLNHFLFLSKMDRHSFRKTSLRGHLGEDEKHQMLNLNQRLEAYLSRVKFLEEDNALLAREIHALQRTNQGASSRRKGLEKELCQARYEVDLAWKERVCTEVEVRRLAEELWALDRHRQTEAEAKDQAEKKLEQSKKELLEEQRAQSWLREKVSQLEHEMTHLVQTHHENVSHFKAKITQTRTTISPVLSQRSSQTSSHLIQLEEEYSNRATRAWQEATRAHQSQLDRLEESMNQARERLTLVGQEKSESQLKLQALEEEITSAHNERIHLGEEAEQQGHRYTHEIHTLQEHVFGLETERGELAEQTDALIQENRGLQQVKTSLGLEVATYRALLDSEGRRGDISLSNQPRNISVRDAVLSSREVRKTYPPHLSDRHRTTSLSSVRGSPGKRPTASNITAKSIWSKKPVTLTETPNTSMKSAYKESPYPKILQDGPAESFRPQEVHEKVTYAEPLSPPNELETFAESGGKDREDDCYDVGMASQKERAVVESVVKNEVECGPSNEAIVNADVTQHQFTTPYHIRKAEDHCGFSDESDADVTSEKEYIMQEPHSTINAWEGKEFSDQDVANVQGDTSDSETEAVLEPNLESRTSSLVSECEHEEIMFDKVAEFGQDENIFKEDAAEMRREISVSMEATDDAGVEDKLLYRDGEEMDTWDSVIERKVDPKSQNGGGKNEEKWQHAEPEEDISAREQELVKREIPRDLATDTPQINTVASSIVDTQAVDDNGQCDVLNRGPELLVDQEENEDEEDEDEDSQNVSVSWRTELEGDSYDQDNTLADTRPLIRYKSDETDATNTQASHVDESESSEGEQDRRTGDIMGSGTWNDGNKTKKSGTMDDLCEEGEVEGERDGDGSDLEYDLGYSQVEGAIVGHSATTSEHATLGKDSVNVEEMIRKFNEGDLDVETDAEENTERMVSGNVESLQDEQLEIDRLVEEDLENLATDSYSAHFAQQQDVRKIVYLQEQSVEENTAREEEEAENTTTEDFCEEAGLRDNHEFASTLDQPNDKAYFSDFSMVMPQADTDEGVQRKDQEEVEKRYEEGACDMSMVTDNYYGFGDSIGGCDVEKINNLDEPKTESNLSAYQDVAFPKEVEKVEAGSVSQEYLIKDVAEFKEVPEKAEWDVLENPKEDFEIEDKNVDFEDYETCDTVPESAESYHPHGDADLMTRKEEPLEISPDGHKDDMFVAKDPTELLKTNGKDSSRDGFFSSGVDSDFWAPSMETAATYQPEDACNNETAEQTNQNLGFAWGNSEDTNVVNRTSRVGIESFEALAAKKDQGKRQVLCRDVVEDEFVRSEESEVEGGSWSSGEEQV